MLRTQLSVLGIAAAIGFTAGCSNKTPDDQTIVTDIQSKLYADSLTKPASIAVTAQNGVVTLSGNVDSIDVDHEARKIAGGTSGVRSVSDKLTLNGAPVVAQEGGTVPSPTTPAASTPPPVQSASNTPPVAPVAAPGNPPPSAPTGPPASSATTSAPAPAPVRPPRPVFIGIPAGERLQVRTIDAISSKTDSAGTTFRASLDAPLVSDGRVVVPVGAPVSLVVVSARSAGRIKGQSELEVRASAIDYRGRSIPVDTSVYSEQGKARGKQTGIRTGIGAAAGALIGGLAGGGKGAAIGAGAGAGAGFGVNALTHGQQVNIPSETVLTFRLEAPLRLPR